MRFLPLCLIILLVANACKKQEKITQQEEWDSGPLCPIESSLIDQEEITREDGSVITRQYSYDALGRVVAITNYDSTFPVQITHRGQDSVWTYHGKNATTDLRTFNSEGDHLTTSWFDISMGDTIRSSTAYFTYNRNHQIQRVLCYRYTGLDSQFQYTSTFEWQDDNIIRAKDSLSYSTTPSVTTYSYVAGTNGNMINNAPGFAAIYLYYTTKLPKQSKNLVSTITYSDGRVVERKYAFDDAGRVETGGVANSNVRVRYKYRCR